MPDRSQAPRRAAHSLAVALLAAAFALPLAGCINIPPSLFGHERGPMGIEVIDPAESMWTSDEILILDAAGFIQIQNSSGMFGGETPGMVVQLKDRLDAAEKNDRIKAVILRIDSPGGGVTASDLIYHELMEFKKKKKVPVIAMMQDVAASGGLYIAMAADEIYAMPTTITGSIGVITMLPSFEELSDKVGVKMRVIKSGVNKDLGSPWRSLSDDERKIFQSMIDGMHGRFLGVILEARAKKGLTREKLMEFADGRVLQGEEAQRLGLIDGVLYLEEAIEKAKAAAGIADASVISYEYPYAYRGNIYAASPVPSRNAALGGPSGDINLFKLDAGLSGALPRDARFMYMWLP